MYTLKDMIAATGADASESGWSSTALGFAIRELDRLRLGRNMPLAYHVERLLSAIEAGSFEVYFDEFARYIGHVAWHLVRPLPGCASGAISTHDSQQMPGYEPAVRVAGLMAPFGDVRQILGALAQSHLRGCRSIHYVRRRARAGVPRTVARETVSRFARRHGARAEVHVDHLNRPGEISHLAKVAVSRSLNLGRILLALRGSSWARRPLHQAMRSIRPPLALKQYELMCDSAGRPRGVITWGWLSPEILEQATTRPIDRLHPGEWNEGDRLCLCGWAFGGSMALQVRDFITRGWFPDESQILTYPSHRIDDSRVRVWNRSEREALADWMIRSGLAHG